jgi:small subunit ribosomal protein S17
LIVEPVEAAGVPTAPAEAQTPHTKTMVGRVASNKMQKTVVVEVEKHKRHRLYHRNVRVVKSYVAHDEDNDCNIGDLVRITETRPLSKTKRWQVAEILERAEILGSA